MAILDLWHDMVSPPEPHAQAVLDLLTKPEQWREGAPGDEFYLLAPEWMTHQSGLWIDAGTGYDCISVVSPSNGAIDLNPIDRRRIWRAFHTMRATLIAERRAKAAAEVVELAERA